MAVTSRTISRLTKRIEAIESKIDALGTQLNRIEKAVKAQAKAEEKPQKAATLKKAS